MLFPKTKTVRDPKYLAWLRRQWCAFGAHPPPCEASHHGQHGIALKPSDHEAVPACHACHAMHHQRGRAPGLEHLSRDEYRAHLAELAKKYRDRYLSLTGGS